MRVLERVPGSLGWRPVQPGAQTFCNAEELLTSMLKHVDTDDTVHGLCVEFENTRVPLQHAKELHIVAQLSSAYYNSLTAEALQHEKDLYMMRYGPVPREVYGPVPPEGPDPPAGSNAQPLQTRQKSKKMKQNKQRGIVQAQQEWDEEKHGDRFVYDQSYEQNEDLVPWKTDKDHEEKFGWYT